jgi:hypothetical protein
MVVFDHAGRMHMPRGDPLVVAFREPLPLDQVLECPMFAEILVIDNFFDLLFFFPVDYVWWRLREVGPMTNHFFVRGEKGCVKDIVYLPVI